MEDKAVYKSSMAIHIICIAVRTVIIYIPFMIIMGLLQYHVPLILRFVDFLGSWAAVVLVSLLCTLAFSIISLNRHKTEITVDNDGGVSVFRGNWTGRDYDISDTIFVFQKEEGGGIFRAVAFGWVIKATDIDGNTETIYAYAFSKKRFYELKENIDAILYGLHEEGEYEEGEYEEDEFEEGEFD